MQASRYTAFIQPEKMDLARSYGLTNFSGFVNKQLDRFIEEERAKVKGEQK